MSTGQIYQLVESGRFDREDFTVVVQPAFTNIGLFRLAGGTTDYSYFAPDCLHPSQKLHGLMARALWNNLLSPEGEKVEYTVIYK